MHSERNKAGLLAEAQAFDLQIEERIAHGHIPDLRRATPCDFFYNNSWRRPEYVRLDFGEQYEVVRAAILAGLCRPSRDIRILEVGCGPGHVALELARSGFSVVGLDLSPRCIGIASTVSEQDPWRAERGDLQYVCGDLCDPSLLQAESFDVVLFVGALHHFRDQVKTLSRTRDLIRNGGIVVAHEPVRDRVTRGNAAFVHLLRSLLSVNGNFYAHCELDPDPARLSIEIEKVYNSLRYEDASGGNTQSINDNEAGFAEMCPALNQFFAQIALKWRYAFFHELIGGLRFDEATNERAAAFLREMDRILVEMGVLQATEFMFVGRKMA